MKISEMIEVLQAAERGEDIEVLRVDEWQSIVGPILFNMPMDRYRIAPKRTLVEQLRNFESTKVSDWLNITARAANRIESDKLEHIEMQKYALSLEHALQALNQRIEELEKMLKHPLKGVCAAELLHELGLRI